MVGSDLNLISVVCSSSGNVSQTHKRPPWKMRGLRANSENRKIVFLPGDNAVHKLFLVFQSHLLRMIQSTELMMTRDELGET